jgi:hypothetical protein
MKSYRDKEEVRWQVVKSMLDEFPTLRKKVRNYIKTTENQLPPKYFKFALLPSDTDFNNNKQAS